MNFQKPRCRRVNVANAGCIGASRPLWRLSSDYRKARFTIRNQAAFANWAKNNPEERKRIEARFAMEKVGNG